MPHRTASPPPSWYWSLPYAAVALFIATMAALLWLTHHQDREQEEATLISDVLWMEQNFSFQFERNAELLGRLGAEAPTSSARSANLRAQLKQALNGETGLVRVLWLDRHGTMVGAEPPLAEPQLVGEADGTFPSRTAFRLAGATGRPSYSDTYPVVGDHQQFEVHVPVFENGQHVGAVVGVYALSELLRAQIPWWFSERYRVSVLDGLGREIGAKSKVAPLSSLAYEIPFEPPGHGINVKVTAYKSEVRWVPLLLMSSLAVLAVAIVWSLWQLRRHMQRRQAAERALRAEYAFRKTMEDSLLTGMRARDLTGRITYVNPAFCKMVGYSAEELIGLMPPMPYWAPEEQAKTLCVHDQILSGNAPAQGLEIRLMRRNGERFDALLIEAPLIDSDGRHTGWMGSVLDITEQKRAQELARQQQERLQATSRLVTMGEMASTLAHELNQPLAAIASYNTGCLNLIERGEIDPEELRPTLQKLGKQAQRAAQIIRRVHDFVRRSEPKCEAVDLNAVLREAIGLVEPDALRRSMLLRADLAEPLPIVEADPLMIEQVAVNLIRNGMDAMGDTPHERRILTLATRVEDGMVVLRVSDRGCGIPAELADKLFAPFFTTKAEGMGMGLNICRSIAELHRGRLSFEPNPYGGTTFVFALPVASS